MCYGVFDELISTSGPVDELVFDVSLDIVKTYIKSSREKVALVK